MLWTLRGEAAPTTETRFGHDRAAAARVERTFASRAHWRETPLFDAAELAAKLGLRHLWLKDESGRLGLNSFKSLGGAYAVTVKADEALRSNPVTTSGPRPTGTAERNPGAGNLTFACASDGNHGLSVAWGASLLGLSALVYLHEGVSVERAQAIEALGATVIRVKGNYDDSVIEASRESEKRGYRLIPDTSIGHETDAPWLVMEGYSVIGDEVVRQLSASHARQPTHVFLQAGVGGFAAAVSAYLVREWSASPPRIVIVEPSRAHCVSLSLRERRATAVPADRSTVMSMLECYEASPAAVTVLLDTATHAIAISDESASHASGLMEREGAPAVGLRSSESGAAGLAGLMNALSSDAACEALELGSESSVLVFNTERPVECLFSPQLPATRQQFLNRP